MRTRCIVWGVLMLSALLHLLPAVAEANSAGRLTIYPSTLRGRHHFAADLNRYYFSNGIVLCAYDLESGKQCWTRLLLFPTSHLDCVFGRRHLALYSKKEGLVVLDAVTGQETWRCLESRDGVIISAAFSDNNDLLGILQEKAFRVYSSTGDLLHREILLFPAQGLYAIPSTDTFYLESKTWNAENYTSVQIYLCRSESGPLVKAFDIQPPENTRVITALPNADILIGRPHPPTQTKEMLYSIVGETGTEKVALGNPGAYMGYAQDGQTLVFRPESGQDLICLDKTSGALVEAKHWEGHDFIAYISESGEESYLRDINGLFSLDGQNNVYYWSLHPGEEPRKILEGRNFLPGSIYKMSSPYIHFRRSEENRLIWERRLLDGLEPMGIISFLHEGGNEQHVYESESPFRVARYVSGKNASDWHYGGTTCVYEEGREEPLIKMEGQICGISPNGQFIIIHSKQNKANLVNVESGEILATYATEGNYSTYACFSLDSRRVAVMHPPNVTVTLMESPNLNVTVQYGDYWYKTICFSPDGTKLLRGGYGPVYIHDIVTGMQLQKFNETARFKERRQYRQGFLDTMTGVAEDFIGNFTDRLKGRPLMDTAFSRNGDEVITIAENNLLRVWNASSGKELRQIEFYLPEQRNERGSINNHVTLSPNGDYALALNLDGFSDISLWSIRTGRVIRRFTHNGPQCYLFAVSDDGRKIYLGREDMLCVYDFGAEEKDNS